MTRAEKKERRRRIAQAVTDGWTVGQAAAYFGVSYPTAYEACREHDVVMVTPKLPSCWSILADFFDAGMPMNSIAEKHNVSRQRVYQIYDEAKQYGIPVPERAKDSAN